MCLGTTRRHPPSVAHSTGHDEAAHGAAPVTAHEEDCLARASRVWIAQRAKD